MSDYWDNERDQYDMKKKNYKTNYNKETVRDILLLDSCDWSERGLRKETLEYFGVKCELSTEIGPEQIQKIFFPYYSQEGKLCGYKCKDLTKDKHEKGHYYTIGHVGVDCQLFGQKRARKNAKFIFICEGESDTLSAYQSLVDFNTDDKFKHLTPSVVGIGCGTVHSIEHIVGNDSFIQNFKEIRLCFDNDELNEIEKKKANPGMKGKEATEAVGNHLLDKNIKFVQWPEWMNDCSDFLQKGKSEDLAKTLLFEVKVYSTEKIVSLYDKFNEGELYEPIKKGIYLSSFPKLMDKLLGIRMKEATLILAPSGVGKSSLTVEMGYNFADAGNGGVGGIFLEEGLRKTFNRFIARRLKIHPNLYKFNQKKYCTYKEYLKAEKWVADENNFLFLDHYGPIKIESLIDFAKIFIYKHNRKLIILDHISLTVTGDGNIDERVELEKAMVSLTTLCENCDVHIIVVAHINRGASVTSGKEREFDKPKWKRTFITDGKGTQALEALAHNIIPIDVEMMPDGSRGRIRLFLGKNREADNLGFCDITRMDDRTGVFYDASQEIWTPNDESKGY